MDFIEAFPISICTCEIFLKDLLKFSKGIISDVNEQQWEKFGNFVNERTWDAHSSSNLKKSALGHCNLMLKKQDEFKQSGIKLSTLLANLIGFIYREQCLIYSQYSFEIFPGNRCISNDNENNRVLAALGGESEYMRLLVSLDLIQSLEIESLALFEFGLRRSLQNFMWAMDFHNGESIYSKQSEILKMAKDVFFYDNYHGSFKRMYLTTVAIQATLYQLKKEVSKAKEYIYCLRMYFAATRDPLLTIHEVRSMLFVCLVFLDKTNHLESFDEEFVKLMPECPAKLDPRNLTDLTRCQIRENIKKCNIPLPTAVEKLNLPALLKSFLLGDVIHVSRKSGNVSPEKIITRSQLVDLVIENTTF